MEGKTLIHIETDASNPAGAGKAICSLPKTSEANARLIAAAPELLEAIIECLPDLEHYVSTHGSGPDKRLTKLNSAIAKATI